jgi:hypothetical protein
MAIPKWVDSNSTSAKMLLEGAVGGEEFQININSLFQVDIDTEHGGTVAFIPL